jgi:hypothetical protein
MALEVTIIPIKWQKLDDNIPTLNCPVCGKEWEQEGGYPVTPCEHLKFRYLEGINVEYFGDWDHNNFDLDEVLKGKITDQISVIYLFEGTSMSCGPVFTSIYYGVKE